jgi:hypothetical protein
MQQNYIYNIPLPRGPGPKKTKRQRTWDTLPGWNKKRRIPHGDTKYLLGTVA